MNENARHLTALGLAAALAIVAAYLKTSEPMLYALSGAIISGEYALARAGSPRDRRDEGPPQERERREQP